LVAFLSAIRGTVRDTSGLVAVVRASTITARHYALAYGAPVAIVGDETGDAEIALDVRSAPLSVIVDAAGCAVGRVDVTDPVRHVHHLARAVAAVKSSSSVPRALLAAVRATDEAEPDRRAG
jgi:hypothetical protein